MNNQKRGNYGLAWIALSLATALHVTDEALHDFLSVYNPAVRAFRERLPLLPLPTFTFGVWLTGLVAAVVLLLALSLFAFRMVKWMVPIAYGVGILMLANGLLHIGASIVMGSMMPGLYSSPILIFCSVLLIIRVRNRKVTGPEDASTHATEPGS